MSNGAQTIEQQAHDDYGPITEMLDLEEIRKRADSAAMPHYRDITALASELERYRRWVDYLITTHRDLQEQLQRATEYKKRLYANSVRWNKAHPERLREIRKNYRERKKAAQAAAS